MTYEPLTLEVGTVCNPGVTLEFTPTGLPVAKFSIRVAGKKAKDNQPATEAYFRSVVAWRELGEDCAESLKAGDRVMVNGIIKTREWDKQDGTKGSATELNAWNVGAELSYATVTIVRNERKDSNGPVPVGAPTPPAPAADFGDF